MPSQLALIICILFVLWLLHLERKQTPNVSFSLWLPTIWMLCTASKSLGYWFGAEADAEGSIDAEKKQTIKKLLEEMKHEANLD